MSVPPVADTPFSSCRSEAGRGPLANHRAFELGECADHLHHHAPGWSGGVDVLRDRAEPRAGFGDPLHDVQHVFQGAGQAVEFPDDDGIAFAQMIEHPVYYVYVYDKFQRYYPFVGRQPITR